MAVKGLNATIQRLRKMDARIRDEVKSEIQDIGEEISQEATRNLGINRKASINLTRGTTSSRAGKSISLQINVISEQRNNGFSVAIIAQGPGSLPAYREFGTGLSAAAYVPSLPKEWQSLAMLYYVNGEGKMIKQPYLYPAYFRNVPTLLKNLQAMLKRETKR